MGFDSPLTIAYSGSLDAWRPAKGKRFIDRLLQWVWTYKHNTVDASTRSAYFLIKAVAILKEKYKIQSSDLQISMWGSIHQLNIQHANTFGVSEFFSFSGYKQKAESLQKLKEADILFLPLEKSNVKGRGTLFIPGKLFEYLNTYKPILALCETSDCRDILEKSGLGICLEPDQPELIAEKLYSILQNKTLLSDLQPDRVYIDSFSFRVKTAELAHLFNKLSSHELDNRIANVDSDKN